MRIRTTDDIRSLLEHELAHGNRVLTVGHRDEGVIIVLEKSFHVWAFPGFQMPPTLKAWRTGYPGCRGEWFAGFRSDLDGDMIAVQRKD